MEWQSSGKVIMSKLLLLQIVYIYFCIDRFDSPDSKVNSLSRETSEELQECFRKFAGDSSARSAVLLSGKPGCFIAGADINMLAG